MEIRLPLLLISPGVAPQCYITSVGVQDNSTAILDRFSRQHSLGHSIPLDDLDLYLGPLSTLWGGTPALSSENIIPKQANISQLVRDKQHVLCLVEKIVCPSQSTSRIIDTKSHSCSDVVESVSHSSNSNEKGDHRGCISPNIHVYTAQGKESSCVEHPDIRQSQHHVECKDSSVDDSGYITLDNDLTPVFVKEERKKETTCVMENKDTKYPIVIRDSSVEVVSETDSEDCYSDRKSFRGNSNAPLPGIQSLQYKLNDTSSKSSIQRPPNTSRTSKSSTRLNTDSAEHKPTSSLLTEKSIRTSHTNTLSLPNGQGLSCTASPGSKLAPLSRERGSPEDEGIVVDSSCEETLRVMSDSGDEVTIVKVVEGRERGSGHFDRGGEVTTQSDIVNCCGIRLTQADLDTLRPYTWLNDQVINSYMKLLMHRYLSSSDQHHKSAHGRLHMNYNPLRDKRARLHITSSFFYTKLSSSGYQGVERWIKNVDMTRLRLLLVPVHLGTHWCLAAVDFRKKCIEYYDSLGCRNITCLKRLRSFLVKCGRKKKCQRVRRWWLRYPTQVPRQHNGSDCGVFVCQFAKWLCSTRLDCPIRSDSKIPFTQSHMPQLRTNMINELTSVQILYTGNLF